MYHSLIKIFIDPEREVIEASLFFGITSLRAREFFEIHPTVEAREWHY